MKKKTIFVLLALIIVLYANIGFAAKDDKDPMLFLYSIAGTSDTYVDLEAKPGDQVSFSVELFNSGTTTKTNSLFICDGVTANNGGTMVLTREEAVRDKVGSWFDFSEEEVTLKAGKKKVVDFVIDVPKNAAPGTHVAVLYLRSTVIEGDESDISSGGASFKINEAYSFSSAVIIRIPGEIKYNFAISEDMEKKWVKDKDLTLFFNISNIGNVYDYPKANIQMFDSLGEVIYTASKDLGVVYPQNDCVIDFVIPSEQYTADIYKIVFLLEFAKNPSVTVQREFLFDLTPAEVVAAITKIEKDLQKNDPDAAEADEQNDLTSASSESKKSGAFVGSIVTFTAAFIVIALLLLLIRFTYRKIKKK